MTYPPQQGPYGPPQQFGPPPGQGGQPPQKKSPLPWVLGGIGALVAVIGVVVVLTLALVGRGGSGFGPEKPSLAGSAPEKLLQAFPTEADVPPGWTAKTKAVGSQGNAAAKPSQTYSPPECSPPTDGGDSQFAAVGDFEKDHGGVIIGIGSAAGSSDMEKIRSWVRNCGHYTVTGDGTPKTKGAVEWRTPSELPGAVTFWIGDGSADGGPNRMPVAVAEVRGLLVTGIFFSENAEAWQIYVKTVNKLADLA